MPDVIRIFNIDEYTDNSVLTRQWAIALGSVQLQLQISENPSKVF